MAVLPESMTAIEIAAPGGPEALRPARRPTPRPASGEVLIKVAAAGVNRPDVLQRQGNYPPPKGTTDIPGLEIAGTVAAVAPDVTCLKEGDPVCALVAGGGYAEYCVAPVQCSLPVPKGLSMVEAGALPETFFTVWDNLFIRGRLAAGEFCLIHGGASGIGTTAIQLAHALGARVFATAGTPEKCSACVELGAERAINYRTEDFLEVVREATGNRGVDVILDMVGGSYFARNLDALAVEGRLVFIATLGGATAELPIFRLMMKRATVTGSTLRARSVAQKVPIAEALRAQAWPLIEQGQVRPRIHATFPLAEAGAAHALMEADTHIGKIVLTNG